MTPDELRKMDAYWRAGNYLCGGMLYLRENPVLREPLTLAGYSDTAAGYDQIFTRKVLIVEYAEDRQY